MDTAGGFLIIVAIAFSIILFQNGKETYLDKCGLKTTHSMPIGLGWQEGLYGNVPCPER